MTRDKLRQYRSLKVELQSTSPPEKARRENIQRQLNEIDNWIDSIEDSFARRVFDEKYRKGRGIKCPKWDAVAVRIGASESHCKHVHSYWLKKSTFEHV